MGAFIDGGARLHRRRAHRAGIDFVDDPASVVPAVLTLAMLGIPLAKWTIYNKPAHASVYTRPDSPDADRVRELYLAMGVDLYTSPHWIG